MRRDARGPSSTNSAYGQFYDRPSVPATGSRDSAHSGAESSAHDRRPSAGRRAHAAAERDATASAASLDHIPAVVVKASDAGQSVGAFTGAVGRTGARRGSSQTFETRRHSPPATSFDATTPRTTRPVIGDANGHGHARYNGFGSERVISHSASREHSVAETASRPFARASSVGAADPPRAAFGKSDSKSASRKPEWNASFATSAGGRQEARQSRVGADALLSARAAEERRRFEKGDAKSPASATATGSRVDRLGRRVASLRGAVASSNDAVERVRPSRDAGAGAGASPRLDAADRALGATLGSGFRDGFVGGARLRASSFPEKSPSPSRESKSPYRETSYDTDEDVAEALRHSPSASATRASLERAAAAASSIETLSLAARSPARFRASPNFGTTKSSASDASSGVARRLETRAEPPFVAGTCTVAGGVNGVAKENQDSFFLVDGGGDGRSGDFAAGVLDGHGADGRRVSRFVCGKIKASLERYFSSTAAVTRRANVANGISSASLLSRRRDERLKEIDALEDVLVAAFAEADAALRAAPRGSVEHEESGCTCVVVVRKGDFLVTANVGDSRAVLASVLPRDETETSFGVNHSRNRKPLRASARATDLSSDHKPDRADEKRRIDRTKFGVVERARDGFFGFAGPYRVWLNTTPRSGGLAVSRAFGDTKLARAGVTPTPEISTHELRFEERKNGVNGEGPPYGTPLCVILASDGVWDHVSSEEAAAAAAAALGGVATDASTRFSQTKAGADKSLALEAQAAADAIAVKAVAGWRGAANGGYRDDITVAVAPLVR